MDGNADHQAERQGAVHDPLPELGLRAAVLLVEMQRRGVVGQRGEEHVVGFGQGAPDGVPEHLPDLKLLEVESGHAFSSPAPEVYQAIWARPWASTTWPRSGTLAWK